MVAPMETSVILAIIARVDTYAAAVGSAMDADAASTVDERDRSPRLGVKWAGITSTYTDDADTKDEN
jgi:hypothetical protein